MLTISNHQSTPVAPRLGVLSRRVAAAGGRRLPTRLQIASGRAAIADDISGLIGRRGSLLDVAAPERA